MVEYAPVVCKRIDFATNYHVRQSNHTLLNPCIMREWSNVIKPNHSQLFNMHVLAKLSYLIPIIYQTIISFYLKIVQ